MTWSWVISSPVVHQTTGHLPLTTYSCFLFRGRYCKFSTSSCDNIYLDTSQSSVLWFYVNLWTRWAARRANGKVMAAEGGDGRPALSSRLSAFRFPFLLCLSVSLCLPHFLSLFLCVFFTFCLFFFLPFSRSVCSHSLFFLIEKGEREYHNNRRK